MAVSENSLFIITRAYQGALLIEPSPDDIASWGPLLDLSPRFAGTLARSLASSTAADQFVDPIVRLYVAVFDRVPDEAGLDFWVDQLRAGVSLTTITSGFVGSDEFAARYGAGATGVASSALVTALYANILERSPEPGAISFWTQAPVEPAVIGVTESPEALRTSDDDIYQYLLGRALGTTPDPGSLWPY